MIQLNFVQSFLVSNFGSCYIEESVLDMFDVNTWNGWSQSFCSEGYEFRITNCVYATDDDVLAVLHPLCYIRI